MCKYACSKMFLHYSPNGVNNVQTKNNRQYAFCVPNNPHNYQNERNTFALITAPRAQHISSCSTSKCFVWVGGNIEGLDCDAPRSTHADMIASLYEQNNQGPFRDTVRHLFGAYVCVIYDKISGELMVWRDAHGIYPLYYATSTFNAHMLFTSAHENVIPKNIVLIFTSDLPLRTLNIFHVSGIVTPHDLTTHDCVNTSIDLIMSKTMSMYTSRKIVFLVNDVYAIYLLVILIKMNTYNPGQIRAILLDAKFTDILQSIQNLIPIGIITPPLCSHVSQFSYMLDSNTTIVSSYGAQNKAASKDLCELVMQKCKTSFPFTNPCIPKPLTRAKPEDLLKLLLAS